MSSLIAHSTNLIPTTLRIALFILLSLQAAAIFAQPESKTNNSLTGRVAIFDKDNNPVEDLSNVVVFIDGVANSSSTGNAKSAPYPQISHKGRHFSPHVMVIEQGSYVDFFNDDNIYHNVFSLSRANPFDLGIYAQGTSKLVLFNKPGLVKLYCNIHPNMVSNILVLNNNLSTVTKLNGTFEIADVPAGKYTLRIWHEFSKEQQQPIVIHQGNNALKPFTIHLNKHFVQHKNKFGNNYKSKY